VKLQVGHVLEELEQAKSALTRLEKSKSDFISVAAHELKTPLTLIEGYASMLKEMMPKGDNAIQAGVYLKGIESGNRRLREIVDDMIDVSIIDNNLLELNFQPVWLNQTLSFVRRELSAIIALRQLNLVIKPFSGSDEMIFGDAERLYQAFRNVITNAIKYTPDGGSITVDGRLLPGFVETSSRIQGLG
jgi:signal transduction histidine kinase